MAPPLAQGCAVLLVFAVLQPACIKSLQSEAGIETLQEDRDKREVGTEGLASRGILPLDPSPCPGGQDYCETADDYPTNQIKDMIKKQPKFILDHFYSEGDDSGGDKFFPLGGDVTQLCASSNTVIFPKKAKSKDGLYEFVVNDNENKQGVRVEACMSKSNNNQCNIPGSLSLGYTSYCVQKTIQRTLVVVDKNAPGVSGFVTKPFEFPSCCACVIEMTGSADRFGITPVGSSPPNVTANAAKPSGTH